MATDDFYELCLEIEASARDWETLRGSAARRPELESKIGVRKRREGRPRRVHLTEQDRATAKRILDHVRSTGSDHPGRIWSDGFVARMMPGMSSLRDSWCPWPAEASSQVQSAAAVVSETCALSEAQYRRRRSAMAARLLAAVGDCSFQLARKKLPDTLDSADGEFDQRRMRRAAEVLRRVKRRREPDAAAVGALNESCIEKLASKWDQAPDEVRGRLERAGRVRRFNPKGG